MNRDLSNGGKVPLNGTLLLKLQEGSGLCTRTSALLALALECFSFRVYALVTRTAAFGFKGLGFQCYLNFWGLVNFGLKGFRTLGSEDIFGNQA